jgi:hypothetical protein
MQRLVINYFVHCPFEYFSGLFVYHYWTAEKVYKPPHQVAPQLIVVMSTTAPLGTEAQARDARAASEESSEGAARETTTTPALSSHDLRCQRPSRGSSGQGPCPPRRPQAGAWRAPCQSYRACPPGTGHAPASAYGGPARDSDGPAEPHALGMWR